MVMKRKYLSFILCTSIMICALSACGKENEKNVEITSESLIETTQSVIIDNDSSEATSAIDKETTGVEEDMSKQEDTTINAKPVIKVWRQTSEDVMDDLDIYEEVHYNEDGTIAREIEKMLEDYTETIYTYNNKVLVKVEEYDKVSGELGVTEYIYDDNGNVIEEKYSGGRQQEDIEYYGSIKYVYDEKGNMIEYIEIRSSGEQGSIKYHYDSDNKLIKTTVAGEDNDLYEYDDNGYLVRIKKLGITESFYFDERYINDSNGNMIEEKHFDCEFIDGSWEEKMTYWKDYEYNENNVLVKEVEYDAYTGEIEIICEYDANGILVSKKKFSIWTAEHDVCDVETRWEYDEYGHCTKVSTLYSVETEWEHQIYTNEYEFFE